MKRFEKKITDNNSAIGKDALEFINALLTSEEIAESDFRVATICGAYKTGQ